LPDFDTAATAPPPNDFRRRCVVTIDEHGSKDRVKDAFSGAEEVLFRSPLPSGAYALKGRTRRRSPPRRPQDIRCRRCSRPRERKLPQTTWTDRGSCSTGAPRREPASREPGCLSPPRSRPLSAGLLLPEVRNRPPAHAAQHVFHRLGKGAFVGLASVMVRSPAIHDVRECEHLFHPPDCSCLGTDEPKHAGGLGRRGRLRKQIVPLVPTPAAVP
jgi:hypothetical protein